MINDTEREQIRSCIYQAYRPGDAPLMAAVSTYLISCRLSHRDFGYEKSKPFLEEMPELFSFFNDPETNAVRVRILDAPPYGERAAGHTASMPLWEQPLEDFCTLNYKTVHILAEYAGREDEQVQQALCEDYRAAVSRGEAVFSEQKIVFPCRYIREDGEPVAITLKPNSYAGGKPWFLCFADTLAHPAAPPGAELKRFAYLGSIPAFLDELAAIALEESWDFENAAVKNKFILEKYITYTFYRLKLEDKICITQEQDFAAFNTGLVDEHYDDIYACFVPNDKPQLAPWRFDCFCTAGGRGMGKRLVECFNPLPQPPAYFERMEDLLFDLNKTLLPDYHHILIDNIARLPAGFLRDQFYGFPEAAELLDRLEQAPDHPGRSAVLGRLQETVETNTKLFNRLRRRLDDAIELARKQVRWNFKTAIPSYYPMGNSMSLMLPLGMEEDGCVDTVLVVELTRSGNYQGQTILTLQQAYIDARLLCRPNSEWLTTLHLAEPESEDY